MYLKNYIVKPVDGRQLIAEEPYPVIQVNLQQILDRELWQFDPRQIPLDILLYVSPPELGAEEDVPWGEICERLDELFGHFLESVSRNWSLNTWFDLLRLIDQTISTYHLVVSEETAAQLIETGAPEEGIHGYGFQLYQHWFEIVPQPYMDDEACYVIPPEYYVTYLYKSNTPPPQRVWVCSFLDVTERSFQPICVQTQSVIDLLMSGLPLASATVEPPLQAPLRPLKRGDVQLYTKDQLPARKQCPECGGPLQRLNEQDAFCLECDWDNLRVIY